MARTRALRSTSDQVRVHRDARVRIQEECLELDPATPDELSVLRGWVGRVNGPAYPQPYLVEGPPGRFRLYVGDAAERVRTARGIQ
ncbi:MAG: hypothetical protein KIT14_18050 [bacterium]|nr:hypothetical protein [bacterium]